MALHGGIALHVDLTGSTKAVGSRGIRGFSRGHRRIGTRSQPRSCTLAPRFVRLRIHPASARSMGLMNSYGWPPKNGGCRVVAIIWRRTWTNGKVRN